MFRSLLNALLLYVFILCVPSFTLAAKIPEGTKLADKQTLIRNNGTEPSTLDPQLMNGVPESTLGAELFEGLTITGANGEILPGVAESWHTDDNKIWVFKLRKDAKWSNGDPVTAHDFVYSFRRLVNPKTLSPYASYLNYANLVNSAEIASGKKSPESLGVKALDDYTLELTLSEEIPYLPGLLTHSSVLPTHKATVEKYGDSWTAVENFVGNGAYKPKLWVVNEKIVLERSPTYWNNKNTIIDEVTFLTIEQASIDVSRYLSGANDIALSVPIEQFNMLKQRYPNELIKENKLCTYYYELNQIKPPFNDVRVREAIKLAVDRDILTKKVKRQFDITAFSFTPPFTHGAQLTKPEWLSNLSYAQRIAKAKKLLQEAGYSKKNPLEFSLLYNNNEAHKLLAIAVASMLKTKLGVNVNLENQEWKTFLETKRNKNHQMVRSAWCADYNEPSAFLNIFLSKSSNNNAGFASPLYDETLKSALSAKTPEARASTYQKAEEILDKESVIIPIYYYVQARMVKPYVKGFANNNPLGTQYTKDMYIVK